METQQDTCAENKRDGLCALCRDGRLWETAEAYIDKCKSDSPTSDSSKKAKAVYRFPNLAGLCRYAGVGISSLSYLKEQYPNEHDRLLAIFEDEALCACASPTLMSAYMKKRLLYAEGESGRTGVGEVSYCFEHDIYADGE